MTDTTDFPLFPCLPRLGDDHAWTEAEKSAIRKWGEQCVLADRASRAPAQEAMHIWIAYDNHTYAELPHDIEPAMAMIEEAFGRDSYIALYTKQWKGRYPTANGKQSKDTFFAECREWLARAIAAAPSAQAPVSDAEMTAAIATIEGLGYGDEPEAIATIRAALNRVVADYDGDGINAETTKQSSAALTASNALVLLRAYDAAQAPQAAEPPLLYIARAKCDSERTVEGQLSMQDIEEKPFECNDPDVWECIGLFAHAAPHAPAAQPMTWRPIETAPKDNRHAIFWIAPKTAKEAWLNTSGDPVLATGDSRTHVGTYQSWGSLYKATHWMPLPIAPPAQGEQQ